MYLNNTLKFTIILFAIFLPIMIIGIQLASLYNKDVRLRNQFNEKFSERTAFYDKMFKTIKQKGKIAVKNDSSFTKIVNIVMEGRKDSEGLMMKWVTEQNPTAQFSEVSSMYKDLSRTIEAQRDEFFIQEKYLMDIKLQSDNLLDVFPSGLILTTLFGKEKISYKPITSDYSENVIKSGKDNNLEVF